MINEAMHTNDPWNREPKCVCVERKCGICGREFWTTDDEDNTCTVCMDALFAEDES